jgi:hypothetical protein
MRDPKNPMTGATAPRILALRGDTEEGSALLDSILKRTQQGPGGCLLWTGANRSAVGNGAIKNKGKVEIVHRLVYMLKNGEIEKGMVVDHKCNNNLCVNPDHLQVLSHAENSYRGTNVIAKNKQKTHCKRGHSLMEDGDVRIRVRNGHVSRECRACHRARWPGQYEKYGEHRKAYNKAYKERTRHGKA